MRARQIRLAFAGFVLATGLAHAAAAQDLAAFMHPEELRGICVDISSRTTDISNPQEYSYAYERKIYAAAGVDFQKDTGEDARAKIGYLWDHYQNRLKCDSADFSVSIGSILKYALEIRTYGFVYNAIRIWRVNLNYIDDSDRRTFLDFAEAKLVQYKGTATEPMIRSYIDQARSHGAKHCVEVREPEQCGLPSKAGIR